jgi:hypothetical protein
MRVRRFSLALLVALLVAVGCNTTGPSKSGIYACTYEIRSTGCGGSGWSAWTTECYQFNIDDYVSGWTPTMVCDKFSGSDTECGGSCCINVQYRNNTVKSGKCS